MDQVLDDAELAAIDAYWRAANYVSVGQIYLGDEAATLAFDVFAHRLVTGIGAMTAAAGGLDALVFTAGIGERSPVVRAAAARRLGHLGVLIDPGRNDGARGDGDISRAQASARSLVIAAREDLEISRETRSVQTAGS